MSKQQSKNGQDGFARLAAKVEVLERQVTMLDRLAGQLLSELAAGVENIDVRLATIEVLAGLREVEDVDQPDDAVQVEGGEVA